MRESGNYESKSWPKVEGFSPIEAIQRICGFSFSNVFVKPLSYP